MKPEWKEFLVNAGAELDEESDLVESFGNAEREKRMAITGNVLCDLSHMGLISAYGDDVTSFLQGQLTNDVKQVSTNLSQLSAYCSAKGRMLANFRLFKHGDTYYLRMPRELVEDTLERLRKYVLRSKVTLEDADDALVRMGYSGPDAEKELTKAVGDIPQEVDAVTQTQDLVVMRVPGPHPRFEIYGELEPVKKVFSALNVHGAPVGASPWAVLEILAGIPTVFPQTVEAFVPQMANMDKVNGVSLKKGCYPGQEIVARTHYLGKLKRRMYRVHIDSDNPPEPGTEIFPAQGESEESVGRVVDAQPDPDDGTAALAVLQRASAETNQLRLGSREGPLVRLETLPYSVED